MKKIYKISVLFSLIIVGFTCILGGRQIIATTTNGDTMITEFQDAYKKNSVDCEKVQLEQKQNIYTYLEYKNNLSQYQVQIEKNQVETEALESLKKTYEECLLNVNIFEFYEKNMDRIIVEYQNKECYKFLENFLSVPVYYANIKYNKELLNQLAGELKILQGKWKTGYATQIEVKGLEARIKTEKANLHVLESDLTLLKEKIYVDTGLKVSDDFSLPVVHSLKTKEEYKKAYFTDSTMMLLEQKEKAYSIYKENIEKKFKEVSFYMDKANDNLKLVQLEKKQYKNQVENSVSEFIGIGKNISEQIAAKEEEIKVLDLRLIRYQKLYEKGKIQKIELTKISTEKSKLEWDKTSLLYNQNLAYYGLNYHITQ